MAVDVNLCALVFAALVSHWLFVSDIHLDPYAQADATFDYAPGDTSSALWESTVREMRRREPNPEVVVLGGDMLAHNFAALARRNHADPEKDALRVVARIASDLGRAFPRAQFLVTLGNNDDPCGDYRSEIGGSYQNALEKIWAPLVGRAGAAPDFSSRFVRGGYYVAKLPKSNMRAIVLNSVLWSIVYRGSCSGGARNPGAAELSWLRGLLDEPAGVPSVVLMHVPTGYDASSTTSTHRFLAVPFLNGTANRDLLAFLNDARAGVSFALGAHVHRYGFRIAGKTPILIASSVSPVYRNNPAFFDLVIDRGTLRDAVPYTYDLREGRWSIQPSFDRTYGIASFTAENLEAASARIRRDPAMREDWIEAYDVWSWRIGDIADHRWQVFWCAQTEQNGGYAACAGTQNRFAAVVLAAVAAVAAVVLTIALLLRRRFIPGR